MRSQAVIAAALLCLAAQHTLAQEGGRKLQQYTEVVNGVLTHVANGANTLVGLAESSPSPPPATTAAPVTTKTPATTAPVATTKAPAPTTAAPATTKTPATTAAPSPTTPAPTTPTNYLPVTITQSEASSNGPAIIQRGSQPLFPSPTESSFNLGPNTVHWAVIGDWGRVGAPASVGLDQCPTASFNGDNNIQGGDEQQQVALEMNQVCALIGGCQFVWGMGDNFYECGVYPGDTTGRFNSDWNNVYNTPALSAINKLPWYNTFGNHDIVINGSVEAEIAYTTTNPQWQMPSNYFYADMPVPAGAPTVRAFFVDANPFIISYNKTGQKYNSPYYQAHLNSAYITAQQTFLTTNLAASKATYNYVIGHYPLFGTATQYGRDSGAYPGNFNGWQMLLQSIYQYNVTAYLNGHDHTMTVANPAQPGSPLPWNGYSSFLTSGAGSWGSDNDSCGGPGSFFYSGGGEPGFIIMSANATQTNADYFVTGSLFSQCTVTMFADKTKAPVYSANCGLGQPNACCNTPGKAGCYR